MTRVSGIIVITLIAFLVITLPNDASGKVEVGIPPDALNWVVGKVDDLFSCARYKGYAFCYSRDGGRKKRNQIVETCPNSHTWDYKHLWGFMCWCVKCR